LSRSRSSIWLGRKLKPIPDKELTSDPLQFSRMCRAVAAAWICRSRKAEVKRFVAEVTIPKQGLCRFDMKHFEQTANAQRRADRRRKRLHGTHVGAGKRRHGGVQQSCQANAAAMRSAISGRFWWIRATAAAQVIAHRE
jgi:hypothetical protein